MEDYHPELANYEPYERRLRSPRRTFVLRALVIVAIAGLVLPGVITTYSFADSNAQRACGLWVGYQVPEQHTSFATFEFFGGHGLGWECYAVTATGRAFITSLGIIPGLSSEQARAVFGR